MTDLRVLQLAAVHVVDRGYGGVLPLARALRLSQPMARDVLDALTARGILGAPNSSHRRALLVTDPVAHLSVGES
jgi:hypothetical protein